MKKNKNIYETHRKLIDEEWDYKKNNELGLDPRKMTYSSNKKVWWKCKKGHGWETNCNHRTNNNTGCPYCAGRKVCKDNCLSSIRPELVKEWNYEKNNELELNPANITSGSHKKVWWICSKGHEWKISPNQRSRQSKQSNCPYCGGKKICSDNCLLLINPGLSKEWNYLKNNKLTPQNVGFGCGKKVWWKCSEGHEWEAVIGSRNKGNGCPKCAQKKRNGKNNPNYNPNLTDEERNIKRHYPEYDSWVKEVYKKDSYTCQICNKKGYLNAHHLMGYNKYILLRLNIDNGITLCEKCHDNFHNIYGRGDNTLQQFKEHIIKINNGLLTLPIFEKLNILEKYISNNSVKLGANYISN